MRKKIGNFWVDLKQGTIHINNCIMEKFDLNTIGGEQFNVQDKNTGYMITVKVIKAELLFDIIKAHTMLITDPNVATVDELIDCFRGFEQSPHHISWFTTSDYRDIPNKAVLQAAQEGNQIVVAEIIPKFDSDNRGIRMIPKADK